MSGTDFDEIETELAFAVIQGDMFAEHALRLIQLLQNPHLTVDLRRLPRQSGKTRTLIALANYLEKMGFSVVIVVPHYRFKQDMTKHADAKQLTVVTANSGMCAHRVDFALVDEPWMVGADRIKQWVAPAAEKVYGLGTPF